MEKITTKHFYKLLIFSFVLLFNPNFNLIDILPDFIAWFILAKLFEKAADSAPYFDEARGAFIKLGFLNILKLPGFILVMLIKGQNTLDNDSFALASLIFAVLEIIFVTSAVKNLFLALFHLGERSEAGALISPFKSKGEKSRPMTPEALKEYTYFFVICKCLLYAIPDFFLLTRVNDDGYVLSISKYYPFVLLGALLLGFIVGSVWLSRAIRYARAVRNEGKFNASLTALATEDSEEKFLRKTKLRSAKFALTMLTVSSFFSFEMIFDNFRGINILPHFIYASLLIFSVFLLQRHGKRELPAYLCGGCYLILSVLEYFFSVRFLSSYTYTDLFENKSAQKSYFLVEIFGILEFIALAVFLVFIARTLRNFILKNTGRDPESKSYLKMEKEFHRGLIKRAYTLVGIGILSGLTKAVNIFLNRDVQLIFTDISDVTRPTITASAAPWFGLAVAIVSIVYIGYSLYFISTLKEEVAMRYEIS
jgi:hypothetical protein